MSRKIAFSIFFLSTIMLSFAFAQNQKNHKANLKPVQKSVLILKDSSNLEITVSRMIKDTLTKLGYNVKEAEIADVNNEKASLYKISIVFSAVNAGNEIDPGVQKFIASKTDTTSRIILYTVYGTVYQEKHENVDATTQATQTLHPKLIADHILRSFLH